MVESLKIKIPRLTGERERKAYIYLPVSYGDGRRFPVLYMFDGHNLFDDSEATYGKSWGLSDYLDYTETPLIVAGVECNTEGNKRLSEYSPVSFDFGGERIIGKGKKYMDWLTGEFKPFIDANYDTLPGRETTWIGGSSMGGLMTLYALAAYNKFFSRGAALSPSLWVSGDGTLPAFIKNGNYGKDTVLYMDCGSREFSKMCTRELFAEACAFYINRRVNLDCRIVPGGFHSEASWEKQVPFFIQTLFYTEH